MKGIVAGCIAAGLAGLVLAQAKNAGAAPPLLGGGLKYEHYSGTAKIAKVEQTDASKAQGAASGGPGYVR